MYNAFHFVLLEEDWTNNHITLKNCQQLEREREKDLILKEKLKVLAYALHNNTIWTSTYNIIGTD